MVTRRTLFVTRLFGHEMILVSRPPQTPRGAAPLSQSPRRSASVCRGWTRTHTRVLDHGKYFLLRTRVRGASRGKTCHVWPVPDGALGAPGAGQCVRPCAP